MIATVVIPTTADRGALLRLSLGSVLRQTIEDLEVFVIGDGVAEASRAIIHELMAADSRVHFFDHPKDQRRGELYRHEALQQAQGRIVCYLTDRDLMLPDHVAEMDRLLADSDFAHTFRVGVEPDGRFGFDCTIDVKVPHPRETVRTASFIPLSCGGHTLEAYRRLPHGWRTTPANWTTDTYMWLQFLEQDWCVTATGLCPTILYFRRGDHPGWPVEQRLEELQQWDPLTRDPVQVERFRQSVREAAMRNRADLLRARDPPIARQSGAARWLQHHAPPIYRLAQATRNHARSILNPAPGPVRKARRAVIARRSLPHVQDLASRPIGDALALEAYWVGEPVGPGPGASLFGHNDEIMRLDCFGGSRGHMHLNLNQAMRAGVGGARLYFVPGTLRDHMERGRHELVHNLEYVLKGNDAPVVRGLTPDAAKIEAAADWMVAHWLELARARQIDVDAPLA